MKKCDVIWTDTAKKDLNDIIEYIAQDTIEIAIQKYEKIKGITRQLVLFPDQGRIIPELLKHNITKYKELIISPWRLIYKVDNNIVYIMAVIDGRRNIEDILLQRLLR
ncbi:MAG: type II toxin-antitoxin system RelE/ParE family toxin [Spirochaetia bacterium]|jgi:toxin ParE1/3/4|nr:type II toxin-antitoxin system RelE/ParE family toxin [Spirochaetia bacterium]